MCVCLSLAWSGLVWFGLAWPGPSGLVWSGPVWFGLMVCLSVCFRVCTCVLRV